MKTCNWTKPAHAYCFGLAKLLPKLNLKQRVIIVAPITESLIGKNAFKPSEIIKTYAGKTVEITNTDGEGRLILADAIAYTIDEFKPKFLIDIATLTGACMVALGDRYAGILGNDKELAEKLQKAGDETDELLVLFRFTKISAKNERAFTRICAMPTSEANVLPAHQKARHS